TYVRRAHVAGARRVLVLATQAVRAAANRAEAVAVIEAACGERVLVLEPEREAALAAGQDPPSLCWSVCPMSHNERARAFRQEVHARWLSAQWSSSGTRRSRISPPRPSGR